MSRERGPVVQVAPIAVSEPEAARMFDLCVNSFKAFIATQSVKPRWIGCRKVYLVSELQALASALSFERGK